MNKVFLVLALLAAACSPNTSEDLEKEADGRQGGTMLFPPPAPLHITKGYNGIVYHGGPIILGQINVYYIWYGDWTNNTAQTVLENFASSVGGSPYFNINTTYFDANHSAVSNSVHFVSSTTDNYSHGASLNDASITSIVSLAISNGSLPADVNAVYFVLTSADVNETSGFCTDYCGWHTRATISGKDIKYAFVGNGDRCPGSCEAQHLTSPNNNPGADGMASVVAHELEESVTDPDLNAWYDGNYGGENADKCAWTFGTTYFLTNGSYANMNLGGLDYLIQRNWVNAANGYCATKY